MGIILKYSQLPYLQAKLTMARQIRSELPRPIPWIEGSINTLYQEIAECLVFGLNHSAISLCGGFLEHALRLALHERVTTTKAIVPKQNMNDLTDDPVWRWLEEQFTLGSLIREAMKEQVIQSNKKWWDEFTGKYRNLYAHCRIFGAVRHERETIFVQGDQGQIDEIEVPVQPSRSKWAMYKVLKDRREALALFCQVTERFGEIAAVMRWGEREPQGTEELDLAEKYKKFFTENWNSYKPDFVDLPDGYFIDY